MISILQTFWSLWTCFLIGLLSQCRNFFNCTKTRTHHGTALSALITSNMPAASLKNLNLHQLQERRSAPDLWPLLGRKGGFPFRLSRSNWRSCFIFALANTESDPSQRHLDNKPPLPPPPLWGFYLISSTGNWNIMYFDAAKHQPICMKMWS